MEWLRNLNVMLKLRGPSLIFISLLLFYYDIFYIILVS